MCKKHNLEQALRGLSLMNPLCNTVALQSVAPLYNDAIFMPWISVPLFIASSEGYFKISRSKYRTRLKKNNILAIEDDFYNYFLVHQPPKIQLMYKTLQ